MISGEPQSPEVLSNKVVLTPISPGNQRGSIWSHSVLTVSEWSIDVDLRATGPERGGGNINIWLVRNGNEDVASGSIYTVGKFDGLALVLDTHGGSGGMIRGFLNDGKMDYRSHHSVDELAFGHCLYSYRNLGRPSLLKLRQMRGSFKVEVDDKVCFETDALSIPPGNKFGITAATPEDNPDSFEIFKVAIINEVSSPSSDHDSDHDRRQPDHPGRSKQRAPHHAETEEEEEFYEEDIPDEDADIFQTSKAQFRDLHNRMQSTNHQISALFRTVSRVQLAGTTNHQAALDLLNSINNKLSGLDQLGELQKRVGDLEKEVRSMRNDLGRKIQANERNFKGILTDHHATLSQTLIDSMPGHKRLFAIVVGTQAVVAVLYVAYKRRRANMPKKYL